MKTQENELPQVLKTPAENVIRPSFPGSKEGGTNLAVPVNPAAPGHCHRANFSKWLSRVLTALPETPISQAGGMLPHLYNGKE